MSTTIYYGQKCKAKNFNEVKSIVKTLKDRHSSYVRDFLKDVDLKTVNITYLRTVTKEFDVDLAFNYDQETDAWYLIPLGCYGVVEHLIQIPDLVECGYWNNTDPLETVTDDEWKERELLWDRLIPYNDSIGEQMFCISLKFNYFSLMKEHNESK